MASVAVLFPTPRHLLLAAGFLLATIVVAGLTRGH